MRLLAASLLTSVAIFGSSQAFGQQGGQSIGGQSGQGIKGQPQGGQPGQSPIGPTGQSIKGQPPQQGGQNPIGQPGQNPIGQSGQPLNGQPGQNPLGQPGLPVNGQPEQNPIGPAGQPMNGQPAQNPIGPNGQPVQNAVGQFGQVPTGLTVQTKPNQIGQPASAIQDQFGIPLYQYAEVRRSLNLTDQQINRLNTAYDQLRQRYQSQMARVNSLPEAQRATELQRLQANQQNEFSSSMKGVFTPQQIQRYRQLEYQAQGPAAFSNPEIQKRLNLSDLQVRRFQDLQEQSLRDLRSPSQNVGETGPDAVARYKSFRQEFDERASLLLNEDQRRAWQEMTGEQFVFQPNPGSTATRTSAYNPQP